nr:hypothetical protein [Tanacetum cinerariifolium]
KNYHGDGNMDGSTTAKEKGRVEYFGITLEKEEEGKYDASAHQNMAKIKCPNEDQRPTKGASTSGPIKEDNIQSISSVNRLSKHPPAHNMNSHTVKMNWRELFPSITDSEQDSSHAGPSEMNDVGILFLIDNMQHDVTRCNTVNQQTNQVNESLTIQLVRYREKVKNIGNTKEPQLMFPSREKDLDSQL